MEQSYIVIWNLTGDLNLNEAKSVSSWQLSTLLVKSEPRFTQLSIFVVLIITRNVARKTFKLSKKISPKTRSYNQKGGVTKFFTPITCHKDLFHNLNVIRFTLISVPI